MKVLVIGAGSYIGSKIIERLIKDEHNVTGVVRTILGCSQLIPMYVLEDVRDKENVYTILKDKQYDIIYHMVGVGNLSARSKKDYEYFYSVNVTGTKNVIDACIRYQKNLKKIIFFSSTAAMGTTPENSNEETPLNPKTPYQRSKYFMEHAIKNLDGRRLPWVIIRPSMVYGPGAKHTEIYRIAKFVKKGLFPVPGKGRNHIPSIYIDDMIELSVKAIDAPDKSIYIATSDEYMPFNNYAVLTAKALNKKKPKTNFIEVI